MLNGYLKTDKEIIKMAKTFSSTKLQLLTKIVIPANIGTFTNKEKGGRKMLPDYSVIGRRIREARLNKKIRQEELADKINVSVAYMSRVETGKSQINLKRLTQIAEVLDVSPGYLLIGSNRTSKEYLKEDFRALLDKCTPEQQKLIYQISELISKTKFENVNL